MSRSHNTAALILHPSRRTEYIKANWLLKWVKPILQKVTNLWEFYQDQALIPAVSASYSSSKKEKEKELDVFEQITQDLRKYT